MEVGFWGFFVCLVFFFQTFFLWNSAHSAVFPWWNKMRFPYVVLAYIRKLKEVTTASLGDVAVITLCATGIVQELNIAYLTGWGWGWG